MYKLVEIFEFDQTVAVVVFAAGTAAIRFGVRGNVTVVKRVPAKVRVLKVRVHVYGPGRTEMEGSADLGHHALSATLHFARPHPHVPIPVLWNTVADNRLVTNPIK